MKRNDTPENNFLRPRKSERKELGSRASSGINNFNPHPTPGDTTMRQRIPLILSQARLALFAFIFAILAFPTFAQDSEEKLLDELKAMQAECRKIMAVLPCATGIGESESLPTAIEKSEFDSMIKMALSLQAFVSVHTETKDSSSYHIENMEKTMIANSRIINQHYTKLINKDNSSTVYRVISLRVLGSDKSLYEAAKSEVEKEAEKTIATEKTSAVPQLPSKATLKKVPPALLGIAKKAIGIP